MQLRLSSQIFGLKEGKVFDLENNVLSLRTRLWQLRAARAARGAPAGGSTGVAGEHKFIEGYYFLVCFRRVSRLRRPSLLRRPRRRAGRTDQPPSARHAL